MSTTVNQAPAVTGASVAALISAYRFRWATEDDLQAGLHGALTHAGLTPEREVRLSSRDRIDLLVGTIGIEVKVARTGTAAPVERVAAQLARYASHEQITELVFVTTTIKHRRMPNTLSGIPVHTVIVGGLR